MVPAAPFVSTKTRAPESLEGVLAVRTRLHAAGRSSTDASSLESPRTTKTTRPSSGIQREVRRKSDLFSFLGCPGVSSSGPARRRRGHAPPPPPMPPGRKKSRNNSQEDRSRSRSCRGLKEKRRVHQEELRIASRAAKCCGTPACRPIRRNVRSRRRCRENPASRLRLCRLIPIGNSKSVNLGAAFVRSQTFAAFVPFPLEAGFPTDLK